MNYMDRMRMLQGILGGMVQDIPSLDKIFCNVSEEEFLKYIQLLDKHKYPENICDTCKKVFVKRNRFGFTCRECVYNIVCELRDKSSNIKILCRGYAADKITTAEDYYSRKKFLPDIKFTKDFKLKIFKKEVQYRVYLPEKHPFTNHEAPMPDTFIPLMLDVYGATCDDKPILGYFTANILGNYFCSNFATGKLCKSYNEDKTISKMSDIGMSFVTKPPIPDGANKKNKTKISVKSKCQECILLKSDVLYAYGIE